MGKQTSKLIHITEFIIVFIVSLILQELNKSMTQCFAYVWISLLLSAIIHIQYSYYLFNYLSVIKYTQYLIHAIM